MVIVKMNNGDKFFADCTIKEFNGLLYKEITNPYGCSGYKLEDFITTNTGVELNVHNISSIQEVEDYSEDIEK
ncbi:MAG: hypothetical protein ACRCVJ_12165 [Clostridium sp.]|uniref:hypothetical protein n=1 Tax=Clostridium sp. TaxID=1506 RepID=UPI003F2B947E